mmetsp:Transcript_9709/g.29037  ORF Transcript_9709/g.29037 Transcript_9709/m.29037 type:complete len:206 (+) Transcript_9709:314-931(+)
MILVFDGPLRRRRRRDRGPDVRVVLLADLPRVDGRPLADALAQVGELGRRHAPAVGPHHLLAAPLDPPRPLGRRGRLAGDAQAAPRLARDALGDRARRRVARVLQRLGRDLPLAPADLGVVGRRPPDVRLELGRVERDPRHLRRGREREAPRPGLARRREFAHPRRRRLLALLAPDGCTAPWMARQRWDEAWRAFFGAELHSACL